MELLKRTTSTDKDFKALVVLLDENLAQRDGEDNAFYAQFNGIIQLKHCVVYYLDDIPVACGAFKAFDETTIEVKRMFVLPGHRGKSIASKILNELEVWAKELSYSSSVLETGLRQPEAIALYKKNRYTIISNYPPYEYVENSVCFKKLL
ncbi:Acetyltransferase (GNAT) family protein [Maribacter orientalis]|uniref:Acetyltransferase (GNAT) family protein n=1 Tax=Maribacter orientalis TaxID=228957 RepID=A0A1H7HAH2_9FLAO|nr:GNAT family N-acetyltransferase [Maribacter orientalis]SEK47251.1 Acetyltransferase (GNAT) family protein [Maribacter orientalis]|tara:strand:- start:5669 stop:6118 length:450 start_codon:yes stop_codon:yes gene_type:complete